MYYSFFKEVPIFYQSHIFICLLRPTDLNTMTKKK